MSERYSARPNNLEVGADQPHVSRYLMARGFVNPGDRVIDAACGTGYGSHILASVAEKVDAIDKKGVFEARWKKDNLYPLVIDLDENNAFWETDVFISIETIEHLKEPQEFLDRITKITKKKIIISSPNKPTAGLNEFHLHDVELVRLEKMMERYKDWQYYHSFIQGYNYIAIYVRKGVDII